MSNLNIIGKKITWSSIFGFQATVYGAYPILVNLSSKNGQLMFNATSMNFSIEIMKLAISFFSYLIFIMNNLDQKDSIENNWNKFTFSKSLYFSIPGFLYFITNNLSVFIQSYMDSTSYQILCNFKILSTTILFYLIMRVKISKIKLFSILLLFLSGIFYVYGNIKSNSVHGSADNLFITKRGKLFINLNMIIFF